MAGIVLITPGIGRAQRRDKVYRIGWMREGAVPVNQTFFDAMNQLGWTAGKDYVVEARYAKASNELPSLVKELLTQNLDVLMTDGTPATRAAKQATSTVPIVFSIGADPVNVGLVTSLSRPGTNLTGFTFGSYNAKQLEMLKAAIPRATRVAYPERTISPELLKAASELGLRIQSIPVDGVDGLDAFFASARSAKVDAVLFPNLSWTAAHEERIAAEAIRNGLPLASTWRSFATSGALLAYGPKRNSQWPRMAAQVDKLLKGAQPGDLAIEQPTQFDLIINTKTAKALGIKIPESVMLRATETIQ